MPLMQVVGVRGSGETQLDYGGYGRTVAAVVSAIEGKVLLNVATDEIDYPAIPMGYGGWTHYAANYKASVADGVSKLTTYIQQFIAGPCGATTYLYLIGYSQGAQVVGDTFQKKLTAPQRQRVGGIAMLGDPRFMGSQTGGVNVGDYANNLNGIFDVIGSPRTVLPGQVGKVRSYCALNDPICNFTKTDAAACKILPSTCPHVLYPDATYKGVIWTTRAANYLVSRWKKLGPKPPVVGPRNNILIFGGYGNGATNLQNALTPAGYTVTFSADLPADLSPYGQVWWYGVGPLSTAQETELVDYAKSGGSLYLSGEWQSCECNDATVSDIFNQIVVTVGGLQFGPDLATGTDTAYVNNGAIDGTSATPNALTTLSGDAIGTISASNIGTQHFLFTDGTTEKNGAVGVWDNADVVGGGRLAIVMDVNWADGGYWDPNTMPSIAQNIASFLSQGTASPAQGGNTKVTSPSRASTKSTDRRTIAQQR
jgi:Cutinase